MISSFNSVFQRYHFSFFHDFLCFLFCVQKEVKEMQNENSWQIAACPLDVRRFLRYR